MAVIATVLTMSGTVAPRERSFTGRFRPCMTGPTATAPAERCTALYVLLPVFRSGKMKTVARPATGLSGSLVAATCGSIAASYWIGPSTSRSGRRSRTSLVAAATFSTSAPAPELPVEYDSIATRGSMPNRAAVSADEMAMSASWSASGSGLTAQSPYTSTRSASSMKKTLEATETPGTVRMISKAGRMVAAVVWVAPETMPSAWPVCTIIVPK